MELDGEDWLNNEDEKSDAVSTYAKEQHEVGIATDEQAQRNDLSQYEARAVQERFRNIGYLEAFDLAKDARLQHGFDEGYTQSFAAATKIGEILGEAATGKKIAKSEDVDFLSVKQRCLRIAKEVYEFLMKDITSSDQQHACDSQDVVNLQRNLWELSLEKP